MTGYFLLLWSIKGSPKQPPSLEAIMGRTHELWKSYIG